MKTPKKHKTRVQDRIDNARVDATLKEADEAFKTKEYSKAFVLAQRVLVHRPAEPNATMLAGLSAFNLQLYKESAKFLALSVKHFDNPNVRIQYALALFMAGSSGSAVLEFDTAESQGGDRSGFEKYRYDAAVHTVLPTMIWPNLDRFQRLQRQAALFAGAWCIGPSVLANPYFTGPVQLVGAANCWGNPNIEAFRDLKPYQEYKQVTEKLTICVLGKAVFQKTDLGLAFAEVVKVLNDENDIDVFGVNCGSKDSTPSIHWPRIDPVEAALHDDPSAAYRSIIDISEMSDEDAAASIYNCNPQIILMVDDPNETRIGVLARKPAPIIISALSYPGTTGFPFVTHLLGDNTLTPKAFKPNYTEDFLHLEGCYFPNWQRVRAEKTGKFQITNIDDELKDRLEDREQYGLDNETVYVAYFGDVARITPNMLDLWSVIISSPYQKRVLWFPLISDETLAGRIKEELNARDVPSTMMMFGGCDGTDHERDIMRLCDLVVDTYPYGNIVQAQEALFVGTPVLTLVGETAASRSVASLMRSLQLENLVAVSEGDYLGMASMLLTPNDTETKATEVRRHLLEISTAVGQVNAYDVTAYAKDMGIAILNTLEGVYSNEGFHIDTQAAENKRAYEEQLQKSQQAANDSYPETPVQHVVEGEDEFIDRARETAHAADTGEELEKGATVSHSPELTEEEEIKFAVETHGELEEGEEWVWENHDGVKIITGKKKISEEPVGDTASARTPFRLESDNLSTGDQDDLGYDTQRPVRTDNHQDTVVVVHTGLGAQGDVDEDDVVVKPVVGEVSSSSSETVEQGSETSAASLATGSGDAASLATEEPTGTAGEQQPVSETSSEAAPETAAVVDDKVVPEQGPSAALNVASSVTDDAALLAAGFPSTSIDPQSKGEAAPDVQEL